MSQHRFGQMRLTLGQGLTHTNNGADARVDQSMRFAGHDRISLAVHTAPLRVPNDRVRATEIAQHVGRHLARKRTLCLIRNILSTPNHRTRAQPIGRQSQVGERRTNQRLDASEVAAIERTAHAIEERGIGGRVSKHLPVTRDQRCTFFHSPLCYQPEWSAARTQSSSSRRIRGGMRPV